jgi:hypothetical protein
MDYAVTIYAIVAALPIEEKFNLADQLRRAAVSAPVECCRGRWFGEGGPDASSINLGSQFLLETTGDAVGGRSIGAVKKMESAL